MKITKLFLTGYLVTGALFFAACSDDDDDIDNPIISEEDRSFMVQVSYGNIAEVEMGRVADSISANGGVRMFGQMMVQDHTTAQEEMADLGDIWEVDLPQQPDSAHMAMKQRLQTLSGYTFDTAYINGQIKDHQHTIALLESMAGSADLQQLRDYASKYLPKVRMHLEKADSIKLTLQE